MSAPTSTKKITLAVFGGNGYVGSHVLQYLLKRHPTVSLVSINRSGKPSWAKANDRVEYVKGDVLDSNGGNWAAALKERNVTGAISCVGAFGSDAFMLKVNGEANVNAMRVSKEQGVQRFVYVSTAENTLPDFVLRGYFQGKRQAERALLEMFPETGTVLRPGFVYGTRQVSDTLSIPLGLVGKPMAALLSLPGFSQLQNLPGLKAVLCPPVSVEAVAAVAASAALGDLPQHGILDGVVIAAQGKLLE